MYILCYIKENGVIKLTKHTNRRPYIYLLPMISIVLIFSLLIAPTESIGAAKTGLLLWFNTVLPSLLPFIIVANVLIASGGIYFFKKIFNPIMKPLFNVPSCSAFPWIMGLVSGYPMGAKITADLRENNQISDIETQRLLGFCNNSGPSFIVGVVGVGLLQNEQLGYFLFIIHLISSILVGIIFRFYGKNNFSVSPYSPQSFNPAKSIGGALGSSITHSMEVIMQIGGYIILFSVIVTLIKNTYFMALLSNLLYFILKPFGISLGLASSWALGMIELSNGASLIASSSGLQNLKLSILSFLIGWGGLSVHAQALHLLQSANIHSSLYLLGKLLHATLSFLLTYLLFPLYLTYAEKLTPAFAISHHKSFSFLSITLLLLIFLFSLLAVTLHRKGLLQKDSKDGGIKSVSL